MPMATKTEDATASAQPVLRMAKCSQCGSLQPSESNPRWTHGVPPFFEAKPEREHDSCYCGCRGWE
jgi:hypothetical protein